MRFAWIAIAVFPLTVNAQVLDVPDPSDGGVYHCTSAEQEAAVKAMIVGRSDGKSTEIRRGPDTIPTLDQGDLAEVNAQRAARGLRPYQFDPQLTAAAQAAASYRARNRIEGHCNDFSFLPPGVRAGAAGCAAWMPGTGFGACDLYANWTFCGAASAIGPDGRRYSHAFYR